MQATSEEIEFKISDFFPSRFDFFRSVLAKGRLGNPRFARHRMFGQNPLVVVVAAVVVVVEKSPPFSSSCPEQGQSPVSPTIIFQPMFQKSSTVYTL